MVTNIHGDIHGNMVYLLVWLLDALKLHEPGLGQV